MAVTQNTYTGNGSTQNYAFSFGYLDPAHVKATINGTPTTAFTFFNASTLRFNTAPANGAAIVIYRETPSDNLLADYTAGSALREQDLELTLQQVLNVTQETQTFAENQSTTGLQAQITTANNNASNAVTTANAASATANGLASSISTANTNASNAVTTANTANTNASNAVTTANNAQTTASNALARSGGTMTGSITFAGGQTFPNVLPLGGGTMTGNINFASTQPLTGVSLNGGPLAGIRNKIINGGPLVNQRNANTAQVLTGATVSAWVCDRWNVTNTGNTSSISYQLITDAPPGFVASIRATINTAKTPAAGDAAYIYQPIEGRNIRDFLFGTTNAVPVVLSFWAKSSLTGTFSGHVRIADSTPSYRSWVFTYSLPTANTWTFIQVPVTANTSFTPALNNAQGMSVLFNIGGGSNVTTSSPGQWVTGDFHRASTANNPVTTAGATFQVAGVQLEAGTQATPFEGRTIDLELRMCQRYYEAAYPRLGGYQLAGVGSFYQFPFKVTKRATPTIGYGVVNAANVSTFNDQSQGAEEFLHYCINTATGGFEWSSNVVADAEL